MAIVFNEACVACQEVGHDKRGNHMMVFDDGARLCNRAHFHKSGKSLYIPSGENSPLLDMEVNGTIKYTPAQYKQLLDDGKLDTPALRILALSGMRQGDRWIVSNDEEKALMFKEQQYDAAHFHTLPVRNLVSRHIRGDIAKLYDVRVGVGEDKQVLRHYYPEHFRETTEWWNAGDWSGAKCRTLPKEFMSGHLGWTHGDLQMFGQHTLQKVLDSGERMHKITLTGGELDALAVQQMIVDSRKGTQYQGKLAHAWSVNKGETAIDEIIANKDMLNRFKVIVCAFDDDDVGRALTKKVARLFPSKVRKLKMPAGSKDPNHCLMHGKMAEFIDAWFNPIDPFDGGNVRGMSHYRNRAKETPKMGLSWPWPEMNPITYGIREYYLSVWGAGTGVGKTATTKEVVFHLAYTHGEQVMVIYLEEPAFKTTRSFAGKLINRDLTAPPCNDKEDPYYSTARDYTEEEANAAIDHLCDDNLILIGDLDGRKDVESVMECMEEGLARGVKYFIIDNLTAFEHTGRDGKQASKVEAIDETMRRLGTFKDEHPVFIMLLSHLNRPHPNRTPHERGGEVMEGDFRGAGSIVFWANDVWGIERDTKAETLEEKLITTYRNVKNRDVGFRAGSEVYARMDLNTGKLAPARGYAKPKPPRDDFDDGTGDAPKPSTPQEDEPPF